MAIPTYYPFKTKYLSADTSSTGGRNVVVVVPARAKYLSTLISLSQDQTVSTAGAMDVYCYLNSMSSTGAAITAAVISSGFSITTSTGNITYSITQSTVNPTMYFNAGDQIVTSASSLSVGYIATHVVQEF